MPAPDLSPMVEQRHYGLLSSPGEPERSGSLAMTQPGHAFEQRGTNPGGTGDTKGKRDWPSRTSTCLPSPQHHSSLLCRLALFLVSLWAPSSRAGRKADGGTLVPLELKAQALPAALGTLRRPQSLCHLCLGWIFKKKISAFSERAYIALVSVKLLTPLF